MSDTLEVRVPDIGDIDEVEVIEVLVAAGDAVERDDSLITLESDKASMDVPAPRAGTVAEVKVAVGDKVSQGSLILTLQAGEGEGKSDRSDESEESDKSDKSDKSDESDESDSSEEPPPVSVGRGERPDPSKADLHAEVLVLGSGPGGYTAAFRAADLGKKVVLVERYPTLGGVCLNVGCIPSKALLHASAVITEAGELAERGIDFGEPKIDLDRLRGWKDEVVAQLTGGLAKMAKQRGVEVVEGEGRLTSPWELLVDTGDGEKTVAFDVAILAAGSRPVELPGIPHDDARVMDSTAALELAEIPRRLLVVGGGIIGLEMASVYAALGSQITVVELLDGLMPGADRDIVRPLARRVEKLYEAIYLETKVTEVRAQKKGLKAFFEGAKAPESAVFDRILVAVGRRPNSDRIGVEAAGVKVDRRGFIPVDKRQRTNVSHIFAIGDLVPGPMLAHKATHEGKVAAEVAAGEKSAFDARAIPSVAYTDPEVAWAGVTEEEAKRQGLDYGKGSFPWSASGRSLGLGRSDGLTKLLFDNQTHRLIGAGIVGPHAGDLIAEVALAIEMGAEAADVGLTIHPHPTLSETVAFAAEAFEGTVTDLYLPKRRSKP